MDGSTVTDFSIDRILSSRFGLKAQRKDRAADGFLQGVQVDHTGPFAVPVPVPVPVQGFVQHPFGAGEFGFYPNHRVYLSFSPHEPTDSQHLPGYHGCHQSAVSAQAQQRQKPRMRTVFTDTQSKQLEQLFDTTDYPTVEARAEVARRAGLSEETVRVWFKNRRARRKRQRSGSKVTSPSSPPPPPPPPPPPSSTDRKIFSSFL